MSQVGGSRLLLGAPDGLPGDDALRLLDSTGASGLLLFRRNLAEAERMGEALRRIRSRLGRPFLVAIDHEGGQVLRHLAPATVFPGNRALGLVAERATVTQAVELARQTGCVMGRELSAMEVRWNLAPVLDVIAEHPSPALLLRSFGREPSGVGLLGAAFARGLEEGGALGCAKHFPGLGAARVDPHHELARVEMVEDEFRRRHLAAFRGSEVRAIPAYMTSHVVLPAFDDVVPVTFSRNIVHGLLREELGYEGVCVSDDLEMGAIVRGWGIPEAAVRAAAAGHDLMIVGHRAPEIGLEVAETLDQAVVSGRLDAVEHEASQARVAKLVARADVGGGAVGAVSEESLVGREVAARTARGAAHVVRDPGGRLPLGPDRRLRILLPDVRPLADWLLLEPAWFEPARLARLFAGERPHRVVSIPLAGDLPALPPPAAEEQDLLVAFDASTHAAQRAILARSPEAIVILARNFWDLEHCPASSTVLDAGGFRLSQVDALAALLGSC